MLTIRPNKRAKEKLSSQPPTLFRDQCRVARIRNQNEVAFRRRPDFMTCHWSKMEDKILRLLKRELVVGLGGRCGADFDRPLALLRSNVAADYQPSFPCILQQSSRVPRMLILFTRRLKTVPGDLKGQAPLLQSYRLCPTSPRSF